MKMQHTRKQEDAGLRSIWRGTCSSQSCRTSEGSHNFPWWGDSRRSWHSIISRTSPDDDLPQDKCSLGKGAYLRWREVWCPRRNHETSEETWYIIQLYGFDVWYLREGAYLLWRIHSEERIGRCHDRRIPIHYKEWCIGNSSQTEEKGCGIFQMDFQNKTCCWWKYWEI